MDPLIYPRSDSSICAFYLGSNHPSVALMSAVIRTILIIPNGFFIKLIMRYANKNSY